MHSCCQLHNLRSTNRVLQQDRIHDYEPFSLTVSHGTTDGAYSTTLTKNNEGTLKQRNGRTAISFYLSI